MPVPISNLGPHEVGFCTFQTSKPPAGCLLRLRMDVGWERKGLAAFITRVKLRLLGKVKAISLNPFEKAGSVFSESTPVFSEEFREH